MKFKLSRGAASETENRKSREKSSREKTASNQREKREALRKQRSELARVKREVVSACRNKRQSARLVAQEGRREVKAELERDLSRIDQECSASMHAAVDPLAQSAADLAAELRGSVLATKHGRQREQSRPKLSAQEEREKRFDEVRHDLQASRPELLGVFERVKRSLKPTDRQTMTEAFLELMHENPQYLEEAQAEASRPLSSLDFACAEAMHEAKLGSPEAQAWAAEHCDKSAKRRPKGSAASRTLGMFGPDLVPPSQPAQTLVASNAPRGSHKRRSGGQQRLSSASGAEFTGSDAGSQIPF